MNSREREIIGAYQEEILAVVADARRIHGHDDVAIAIVCGDTIFAAARADIAKAIHHMRSSVGASLCEPARAGRFHVAIVDGDQVYAGTLSLPYGATS